MAVGLGGICSRHGRGPICAENTNSSKLELTENKPENWKDMVAGLCWGEWGIVGKSGGVWWNGAGSRGSGVAGVARK
nr:hypothetical protein [Tanacetum cinerariifolium]